MKNKETVEEAAEKYAEIYRCPATNDNEYCRHDIISAINFGAKWQQERMYSLDEIKTAMKNGYGIKYFSEHTFLKNLNNLKKK